MTDHQQAAIEAAAYRLLWKFEGLPHGTRGQVAPYVTETHLEWAEDIIADAEPHLRRKWAKEIIDELDTARATGKVYTYGEVQELIRNGVGE